MVKYDKDNLTKAQKAIRVFNKQHNETYYTPRIKGNSELGVYKWRILAKLNPADTLCEEHPTYDLGCDNCTNDQPINYNIVVVYGDYDRQETDWSTTIYTSSIEGLQDQSQPHSVIKNLYWFDTAERAIKAHSTKERRTNERTKKLNKDTI